MDPLLIVIILALIAVIITMMLGLVAMGAGDARLPGQTSNTLLAKLTSNPMKPSAQHVGIRVI